MLLHQAHVASGDRGYIWPKRDGDPCGRNYNADRRSKYCKDLGFAEGARCVTAWRHISRRDMPPRTPEEAEDMAARRGSSARALYAYGIWRRDQQ